MSKLIWLKRKKKGQLAYWETIKNHPQFRIQAVDGQPLQQYLYSAMIFDSSLQRQCWRHLGSCSDLKLAQETCERENAAS